MNKGSFIQFVKGNTAHRLPKIATLAITSCVLVAMVAIDASASPNAGTPLVTSATAHASATAAKNSLLEVFGLGRHHKNPIDPTPTTTTTAPESTGGVGGGGGGGGGGGTTTTTTPGTTITTPSTTTTTTISNSSTSSGGLITAGDSRSECLVPNLPSGPYGLSDIVASVAKFQQTTGSTVTCLGTYDSGSPSWAAWDDPWFSTPGYGFTGWVAQDPSSRQLVLGMDLIPATLENISNPLSWEEACDAGDYDGYATTLGNNLVAAGLQNSVIRLGVEMNGPWEVDYVGSTTQEQNDWATCYANEVTAMRQASGENFLFVWNPNACTQQIPYANYYPGNQYVDIVGLDLYDQGCEQPNTALTFSQLSSETYGLTAFEAFASAHGKALSLPEWGLTSSPGGDDAQYVAGVGSSVNNGNFAFQEYFDVVVGDTMQIDQGQTPLAAAAYKQAFG